MTKPIDRDRVQPFTGGLEAAAEVRERIVPELLAAFSEDVRRLETAFELEQVQVRPAAIEPVCRWLHERGFNMLLDLGGADYLPRQPRFEVIYHLLAVPELWRLRLRVKLAGPAPVGELVGAQPEPATLARWRAEEEALGNATEPGPETPELASVGHIWPNAWPAEREVWDQFGIRFAGHPNLTRILNPEDWEGFPLRRDYPLRGPRAFSDDRTTAEQNRFAPIRLDEGDRR